MARTPRHTSSQSSHVHTSFIDSLPGVMLLANCSCHTGSKDFFFTAVLNGFSEDPCRANVRNGSDDPPADRRFLSATASPRAPTAAMRSSFGSLARNSASVWSSNGSKARSRLRRHCNNTLAFCGFLLIRKWITPFNGLVGRVYSDPLPMKSAAETRSQSSMSMVIATWSPGAP